QVQMPITLLLLIGFATFTAVTSDPRGSTATVVTMLPFWSPLLMPMRYLLGGASLVEVALSLAILVVSTVLIARAAAKIYRADRAGGGQDLPRRRADVRQAPEPARADSLVALLTPDASLASG